MRIVLFILLLLNSLLQAESICLDNESASVNVVPYSSYAMATRHALHKKNILSHSDEFTPGKGSLYSFGFMRESVWIRFAVERCEPLDDKWVINIDYPHIDKYTLYVQRGEQLHKVASGGDKKPFDQRQYPSRTFWTDLQEDTHAVYYLHVKTDGTMQIPITLERLDDALHDENRSTLLYGLYYGILLSLLLYNIILFIIYKESHYLNYLIFLGAYTLWQLSFDGVGFAWLWPEYTWLANSGMSLFVFITTWTVLWFTKNFLQVRRFKPVFCSLFFFAELISIAGVVMAVTMEFSFSIKLAALWMAVVPFILIFAAIKVLPEYRPARFYLLGWSLFLFTTLLTALYKMGWFTLPYISAEHLQQIGSLWLMAFFSYALSDRIKIMSTSHINRLQQINTTLLEEIDDRVNEIRNKDQMMIQQSRQAAMGEMIENIAHQWRQPLHQLSLIQQNIFFGFQLKSLTLEQMEKYQEQSDQLFRFMGETIDDFRNFFQPDKVRQSFHLHESVDKVLEIIKTSIDKNKIKVDFTYQDKDLLVGYANEFSQVVLNVINNAKDVLKERKVKDPKVIIRHTFRDNKHTVTICDNAGGIDKEIISNIFDPYFTTKFKSQGTGIGLYMSKMIIEKSMEGTLKVSNTSTGACFSIVLPNKVKLVSRRKKKLQES